MLRDAQVALSRVRLGRPAQSQILVGLRGVGKTVLLVRIKEIAEEIGYRALLVEAHENKNLPSLLVPPLRQVLYSFQLVENAKDKARRGLRILKSFLRSNAPKRRVSTRRRTLASHLAAGSFIPKAKVPSPQWS